MIKLEINVESAADLKKDIVSLAALLAAVDTANASITEKPVIEEVQQVMEDENPILEAPVAKVTKKRNAKKAEVTAAPPTIVQPAAPTAQASVLPPLFPTPSALNVEQPTLNNSPVIDFGGLNVNIPAPPAPPAPPHEQATANVLDKNHGTLNGTLELFDISNTEVMRRYLAIFNRYTINPNNFEADGVTPRYDPANFDFSKLDKFLNDIDVYENWIKTNVM